MNSDVKQKLRFAPSPNGYMHLGHAYSALLNVEIAKELDAEFIIRMEDIDQLRCTDAYKTACLEDLAAIGVESDAEIIYQSERQDAYETALDKLMGLGVLYPCLATRGDIKRHYETHEKIYDPDGGVIYPHLYKYLSIMNRKEILTGNEPFALRLDMFAAIKMIRKMGEKCAFLTLDLGKKNIANQSFDPMVWGDVIVARKDIGTSYHLSVVVDDAMQNVSHIVRGMDLYYATYIHRVLQVLLGLPQPLYFHHQLLLDDELNKLAKRSESLAMREILSQNKGLDYILDLLERENMRKIALGIGEITHEQYDKKPEK